MEEYISNIDKSTIAVGVLLFFSWVFFYYYFKNLISSFLNTQNNITALYNGKSIKLLNKAGLDFWGYKSFSEFRSSHADVSDLFIEEKGCMSKHTYGKGWVERVYNDKNVSNNTIKIKTHSKDENLDHYFLIKISKMMKLNKYILSFSDITKLESEKLLIQKDAELDPLTQIYNRVKLNSVFDEIFTISNPTLVLSIILFDIDHFKRINDEYGHMVGDKVLKELARLVNGLLTTSHIFARWGGEEFIIVLEGASREKAQKLASTIRKEIEKYPFDDVSKLTCSFGVAQLQKGDTQSLLFERVDEALYEAKENGRNQVVTK